MVFFPVSFLSIEFENRGNAPRAIHLAVFRIFDRFASRQVLPLKTVAKATIAAGSILKVNMKTIYQYS
jgi:hypothetical protein